MQRDYYRLLGVDRAATPAEIRSAYARLLKRHHPDAAGTTGPMTQRLHDYQRAYRCLSDSAARAAHDRALDQGERLHLLRQERLQGRLRRYDLRHPRGAPKAYRNRRWRHAMWLAAGVALAGGLSALFLV